MKHSSNCHSYYNYAIGFYVFNSSLSSWYIGKKIVTDISLDTTDEIDLTQYVISQFISITQQRSPFLRLLLAKIICILPESDSTSGTSVYQVLIRVNIFILLGNNTYTILFVSYYFTELCMIHYDRFNRTRWIIHNSVK